MKKEDKEMEIKNSDNTLISFWNDKEYLSKRLNFSYHKP